MSYHLSDEVLICFIDSQPVPNQVRSHLQGCIRCQNEVQELRLRTLQFEQLVAHAIPAEFPHSDIAVGQLRRRLIRSRVLERPAAGSLYDSESAGQDSTKPTAESRTDKTDSSHSCKVLMLPQQRRSFRMPRAYGVTFTDGDNLFREGHRAYAQGAIERAIEYWREAKIVFLRLDYPKHIAACDRNVAIAQTKLGHSDEALEQFRKAKKLFEKIGDLNAMASCDLKIGELEKTGHTWR